MINLDPEEQRRLEIETAERAILTEPEHNCIFPGEKIMMVAEDGKLIMGNFIPNKRPRKDLQRATV